MLGLKGIDEFNRDCLFNLLSPFNSEGLKSFFATGKTTRLSKESIFRALKVAFKVAQFQFFQDLFFLLKSTQQQEILQYYTADLLVQAAIIDLYEPMRNWILDVTQEPLTDDVLKDVLFCCIDKCQLRATRQFLQLERQRLPFEHLMSAVNYIRTQILINLQNFNEPNNTASCTHVYDWPALLEIVTNQAPAQSPILHQFAITATTDPLHQALPLRVGAPSRHAKYKFE